MTANQIKFVALKQFVDHGFAGTSLANIGDEVGIKKQSIYSHFKSKDDLFLIVFEEAIRHEIEWMNEYFEKNMDSSLHDILYRFLEQIKERYFNDYHLSFLLRMAFYPPVHLHERVMGAFETYLQALEHVLQQQFSSTATPLAVTEKEGAISYMNLLDGLIVELIYQGVDKFFTRLDVSWKVYWRGISSN
ncbi:TetR/AcrR family transcriptional regulator [Brevibacillus fluminis]|uniref:TetR/AcrR family transcriptional regulator n=1 Tax=Brevibacillus fluminis TaxID=511487 RepID=A0A3M8DNV2_9BACL|nr:TetR/AcrR family transcriptional regulator [Brevibacillus fluminis]RNB89790.1 TetR/AcrR family transcriptional regulator [Brevibacillus fluminis]